VKNFAGNYFEMGLKISNVSNRRTYPTNIPVVGKCSTFCFTCTWKRIYASEYGYYIVKDATLKVRLATKSVGSALKRLLKTSLGGAFPYYSSAKLFKPFGECYILANENFGEQPIESIQRAIEEYYFALAQHIYQGKNINYALIPVVKPYKRSIYKVELFGSEEMIALANVVGLRVGHFGLFLYDSTDLNLITKLSQKLEVANLRVYINFTFDKLELPNRIQSHFASICSELN